MDALINVVIPVFGIVLAGYLAGRFSVLGSESAVALNRFVYYFALPALLFVFTARAPLAKVLNWPFIAAFIGAGMLTLFIALLVGRFWFRQDFSTLSMHGLTSVYGMVQNQSGDNVAHFAHLGGLGVGIVIMLIWKRNKKFFF